ncbi:protein RRNAD1 isoform X2 [Anopheles arabiensis]|uniref:protein RRNAD1 isoform X2 n=1 Tax=Anopheles arabiensis TaxID=7173 RepID=UPI001AACF2B1|nr:protein RRNAD1 isoform X2 [Anopheles arabiensis]
MDGNIPRLQAELQQKILESRTIVDLYRPIIDAYIVDFFHLNHWNSLPPSWIRCFSTIPIEHLPALLSFENRNTETTVWPLTVLTLRSLFRRLVHTRSEPKTTEKHPTDPNCVYYKQSSLFHKSVKLKKRHEIEQFATNCSRENNCRTLVDIGSGQGNLARTLAYGFGFRVCCLEQNESFVQAARQKDAELWRRLVKLEPKLQNTTTATPHPVHLHEKVNLDHIDPNAFEQLLRDALNIEKGQHSDALQFGLIGLHPCGDLAPSLLRLFLACHECRFIKLVCCCYMKLSCESSISNGEPKEYGFPLSDFCRRTNLTLSYEAREMACHAIEQYRERLSACWAEGWHQGDGGKLRRILPTSGRWTGSHCAGERCPLGGNTITAQPMGRGCKVLHDKTDVCSTDRNDRPVRSLVVSTGTRHQRAYRCSVRSVPFTTEPCHHRL